MWRSSVCCTPVTIRRSANGGTIEGTVNARHTGAQPAMCVAPKIALYVMNAAIAAQGIRQPSILKAQGSTLRVER